MKSILSQIDQRPRFAPIRNPTPEKMVWILHAFERGYLAEAALAWETIDRRDDLHEIVWTLASIPLLGTTLGHVWTQSDTLFFSTWDRWCLAGALSILEIRGYSAQRPSLARQFLAAWIALLTEFPPFQKGRRGVFCRAIAGTVRLVPNAQCFHQNLWMPDE